jgi:hypothetical protein
MKLGIPTNGATVTGGNRAGPGDHLIQCRSLSATVDVTIVGITGVNGTDGTLLNSPSNLVLSTNETFLYVSDRTNNRVQ